MKNKRPLIAVIVLFFVLLFVIVLAVVYSFWGSHEDPLPVKATRPTPPANKYLSDAFYYEDGLLRYNAAPHKVGIDISVFQGIIDWQKVADAGVDFAILRAGYRGSTQGELYEDEQFSYNLQEAKRVGIEVGIYFFSQAITTEEAIEEADYVCSMLQDETIDLPIYFDWELLEGRASDIYHLPLTDFALAFCQTVSDNGFDAGVYFNKSFGYSHLDLSKLQDYSLWLAEYNPTPTFRYHFDLLQYSASGRISGIDTTVDLNILFLPKE